MDINDRRLTKQVAKGMLLILLAMLSCKVTGGVGAIFMALFGVYCAFANKTGWAIIAYIFFPFMVTINPYVWPQNGITKLVMRLTPMVVTIGLVVAGFSRVGRHKIPLGMIWIFLVAAFISSMGGYYPMVSYLKIVNCAILFAGIAYGFSNIDKRPKDVMVVRNFLLVITSLIVWGSWLIYFVSPGAAYVTSVGKVIQKEGMMAAEEAVKMLSGPALFAGITNQSQCLGSILPCSLAWLACDMFFVERRISKFHMATIIFGFPLVYMTRSRTALLTTCVAGVIIYFYCLKKVNLSMRIKARLRMAMTSLIVLVFLAAAAAEVRNGAMSKWLRKTDDLAGDERGLGDAFTHSRQAKVDENMRDFWRNPLLGSGFQVSYDMQYTFAGRSGLILSASIEKSILPLMVLGETGVVGFSVFLLFLLSFYATCVRKRYFCCATLMTVFITTNMSEGTFFSPGGVGGYMWIMCVGGGFIIDTVVLFKRRMAMIVPMAPPPPFQRFQP